MGLTDRKRDGYILLFKRKRYIIFIVSLNQAFLYLCNREGILTIMAFN